MTHIDDCWVLVVLLTYQRQASVFNDPGVKLQILLFTPINSHLRAHLQQNISYVVLKQIISN